MTPEKPMLTAILIAAGAGLLVGGGTTYALTRDRSPAAVEAVASVVGEVAVVADVTGEAANAERLAELALQAQIAGSQVKIVGMTRLVAIGDARLIGALTAYDVCVSAAQGKGDSAAFNCEEAQKDVSQALDGLLVTP